MDRYKCSVSSYSTAALLLHCGATQHLQSYVGCRPINNQFVNTGSQYPQHFEDGQPKVSNCLCVRRFSVPCLQVLTSYAVIYWPFNVLFSDVYFVCIVSELFGVECWKTEGKLWNCVVLMWQGFTLNFMFEPNEHFTNPVLTKEYFIRFSVEDDNPLGYEGPDIVRCTGSVSLYML